MFDSIALILIGVLISGIGYLIKRFIEKKSDSEALDKHKKLLEINKQMTEQRVPAAGSARPRWQTARRPPTGCRSFPSSR